MSEEVQAEQIQVLRITATDAVLFALALFLLAWQLPRACARYVARRNSKRRTQSSTPLLYPFHPLRAHHAYTSLASLKAAARSALRTGSHSSPTAHFSHLWPLAEEVLRAGRVQIDLEDSQRPVPEVGGTGSHRNQGLGGSEYACMELGSQLPIQDELTGVPIEGKRAETDMHVLDACTDDDYDDYEDVEDGSDSDAGVVTSVLRAEAPENVGVDGCPVAASVDGVGVGKGERGVGVPERAAPAAPSDTPQAEVVTSSGVDNAEGNDLEGGKPCEGNIAPAVQPMDGRQTCGASDVPAEACLFSPAEEQTPGTRTSALLRKCALKTSALRARAPGAASQHAQQDLHATVPCSAAESGSVGSQLQSPEPHVSGKSPEVRPPGTKRCGAQLQPAGAHCQHIQNALRSALSYIEPPNEGQEHAESAEGSGRFQHALFACMLVCGARQQRTRALQPLDHCSLSGSVPAHVPVGTEEGQLLMHAVQSACGSCIDVNSMKREVGAAVSLIPDVSQRLSPEPVVTDITCMSGMHDPSQEQQLAALVHAALSSLTQQPDTPCSHNVGSASLCPAHSRVALHGEAGSNTACAAEHSANSESWRTPKDSHVLHSMSSMSVCATWIRAAVAAMVPVGPGQQQTEPWWCALCCPHNSCSQGAADSRSARALPCMIHMHCGVHALRCTAALHVANAIIVSTFGCEQFAQFELHSSVNLSGEQVTASKLLEESLHLAWQELQQASRQEQTVVCELFLSGGAMGSKQAGTHPRPHVLASLVAVFEQARGSAVKLNTALAAVTNGLSMGGAGEPGAAGGVVDTDDTSAAAEAASAAAPALLPAVAVVGCAALFRHMWRLAASQPANAALWAALCCSTAAAAGSGCPAVAADQWAAAARSAAAAGALAAPAARSAAVQCTAAICSSSAAPHHQPQLQPQARLQQVVRGVVLPLLRRSCAADAGSIRTALGCLDAAAAACKGHGMLVQKLPVKDWVELVCALCTCSFGRWAWHLQHVTPAATDVDLDLLQAQHDAAFALQMVLASADSTARTQRNQAHAYACTQEVLEASEAATRFCARYRSAHPPHAFGGLANDAHARFSVLCPQVDITLLVVENTLQRHAFRAQCRQRSGSTISPTAPPATSQQPSAKESVPEKKLLEGLHSALRSLHAQVQHDACHHNEVLQQWCAYLSDRAMYVGAFNQQSSEGKVSKETVVMDGVGAPVDTVDAAGDGLLHTAPPAAAGTGVIMVVTSVAALLALFAMPMHAQRSPGITGASRVVHRESQLRSMLNACLFKSIEEPSMHAIEAAPVATAASVTGTIAVLMPEFPAKISDSLLMALVAIRKRYLPAHTSNMPLQAQRAGDLPLKSTVAISHVFGAVSLAAAAAVALSRRAKVVSVCMRVLTTSGTGGAAGHGITWPQGWLVEGDLATGARAVGAAVKVLCGVCIAAVNGIESILETPGGTGGTLHRGEGRDAGPSEAVLGADVDTGMHGRFVVQGAIVQLLLEACTAVLEGPLVDRIDMGAVQQTLTKLLEGFRKLLQGVCGSEREKGQGGISEGSAPHSDGAAPPQGTCSGMSLAERSVEAVVSCIMKLPVGLVDGAVCGELCGIVSESVEGDDAVLDGQAGGEMTV